MVKNKSPLRYPGGKTRACKKLNTILQEYFDVATIKNLVSPFIGGGSFEFYLQNQYGLTIYANDKFSPLSNFWLHCKLHKEELCSKLYVYDAVSKDDFKYMRDTIIDEPDLLEKAIKYFIINRCSFSGATLSGGFSQEASKKRFNKSSIDRVNKLNLSNFNIYNLDFLEFLEEMKNVEDKLIFLDPPYYLLKKSKLYGKNGDLHENFNHIQLYNCISDKKKWIMTYNNCDYIKDLYKDFKIIETDWSYSMNKNKKSSEIIIVSI